MHLTGDDPAASTVSRWRSSAELKMHISEKSSNNEDTAGLEPAILSLRDNVFTIFTKYRNSVTPDIKFYCLSKGRTMI